MYFCHVNYNESATTELPSVHNGQAATARRNKKDIRHVDYQTNYR